MKYSIGIDYGSLSGRCILVNIANGDVVATAISKYTHAVMDRQLTDDIPLPLDWALQHPQDYIDVLFQTIPVVLHEANVDGKDIIGIGIDFTGCTVLPLDKTGTPLCFLPHLKSNPHSYVKLWKHHASQPEADLINQVASDRKEPFLNRYGGKISSEWLFPKLLQILHDDPSLYDEIDCFIEAADWVPYYLTGNMTRNYCSLGFKAMWHSKQGFPSTEFFKALDPRFEYVVQEKIKGKHVPVATNIGTLRPSLAHQLGLSPNVCVSSGHLDAACSLMGAGINSDGSMLAVVGTSTCHMLLGKDEQYVPGICGYVEDGFIPGFLGYEAGQSCVGDHFQWLIENCTPSKYLSKAEQQKKTIFQYLGELAAAKPAGANGLLALDWWNGNRSILNNGKLSGLLIGCTLQTKVEDIYRALIEATAFGTRVIVENFNKNGVPVKQVYFSGGIARKDPFMMQIYADVLGMDILIVETEENAALSASICGALAAKNNCGYFSFNEAIKNMSHISSRIFRPNLNNKIVYDELYFEYCKLYEYFGDENRSVMKNLKKIAEGGKKQYEY
ncbi:ribulokinase [Treponema parvum]|uniref:Ribulokinase n=1 Tax=Treponema parvum TaxID=138851 RepID=A0A975F5U0_9SPIR|nr:ribulokinase [Treponema parvum]QTQ14843.1 ribulokinase [Treponema parvum]